MFTSDLELNDNGAGRNVYGAVPDSIASGFLIFFVLSQANAESQCLTGFRGNLSCIAAPFVCCFFKCEQTRTSVLLYKNNILFN